MIEAALLLIAISLVAVVALSVVGRSHRGLWQEIAAASTDAQRGPATRVLGRTVSPEAPARVLPDRCRGSCSVLATRGAWHDVIAGPWDPRWRPGNPGG